MRVLLAPHGTRGDIQPTLALAVGLRERGHETTFLVPDNFVSWIRGYGFSCEGNGIDVEVMLQTPGADLASFRWQTRHFKTVMVPALFDAFKRTAIAADVILGAGIQLAAASAAEARDVPYASIVFCPCAVPNSAAPPPTVRLQSLPHWVNRILWQFGPVMFDVAIRGVVNAGRANLGLPAIASPLSQLFTENIVVAADPDLAPLPDDVPDKVFATDAWVLAEPGTLDPRVERFLQLDPPPIYVGFGSMIARKAADLAANAVAAARALGRALLLGGGWATLDRHVMDADDVLAIGAAPHALVFPRVAVAVHHGGAGTTTAAARAGVPQVILPHILDQHYWAHRVEQLGLGPRPVPVDLVTADILTDRIASALTNRVRARAAAMAPAIAARNGVNAAVDYLERLTGRPNQLFRWRGETGSGSDRLERDL
jgi:vancomycin aglycone glucosyltransferase